MALTAEDKKEVQEIIKESFKAKDIDISIMQQEWKKFKEAPEARLAALEVKIEDLTYEFREFKKEVKAGFEEVNKRFDKIDGRFDKIDGRFEKIDGRSDQINNSINDLYKTLNAQVWKFIGSLGFILILLKLAGALFP